MPKNEKDPIVAPSSGNVFADLGFADAEERKTKVRLAFAINRFWSGGVSPRPKLPATGLRACQLPAGRLLRRATDALLECARPGCGDCHSQQTTVSATRQCLCHRSLRSLTGTGTRRRPIFSCSSVAWLWDVDRPPVLGRDLPAVLLSAITPTPQTTRHSCFVPSRRCRWAVAARPSPCGARASESRGAAGTAWHKRPVARREPR